MSWNFNLGALKYYRCLMMSLQDSCVIHLSGSQTGGCRKGIVDCCSCLAGSVRSYSHQKLKFALHLRFWSGQSSSHDMSSLCSIGLFVFFFIVDYCRLLTATDEYIHPGCVIAYGAFLFPCKCAKRLQSWHEHVSTI